MTTKEGSTILTDVQNFYEKTRTLCFIYVTTKLSKTPKLQDYYALHLRGLQCNSSETLARDLKQLYVSPRHWYFRRQQSKDWQEQALALDLKQDPTADGHGTIYEGVEELEIIVDHNNINPYEFASKTREHLFGLTKKFGEDTL